LKIHFKKTSGFTLVEMIIYVAIFSMIFTMTLSLFDRVQVAGNKARIASDLKEEAVHVMQLLERAIREADSVNFADSVFDLNPGRISLTGEKAVTVDTHLQTITTGGISTVVRKLKMRYGTDASVSITSDQADVIVFQVRNMSQPGSPPILQVEIGLATVNPGHSPNHSDVLLVRDSFVLRKDF
jgi:type II secretory pathway pseudopilin PulG